MRKLLLIMTMLYLGAIGAGAQHYDRGYESVPSSPFIPKGVWTVGGNLKYSQHVNDNYNMLVINDINSTGFNVSVSPKLVYTIKDNIGVGLRLSYDRSMLDLATADISAGDISMSAEDCYQIQHRYGVDALYRAYIPLGSSKRIAMFADLMFGGAFKQAKAFNGGGEYAAGTYTQSYMIRLAVDSGIVAFLADRLALELNVGVFGLNYQWANQIHNQIEFGQSGNTSAGYMVDLLSLGVGISYYFL